MIYCSHNFFLYRNSKYNPIKTSENLKFECSFWKNLLIRYNNAKPVFFNTRFGEVGSGITDPLACKENNPNYKYFKIPTIIKKPKSDANPARIINQRYPFLFLISRTIAGIAKTADNTKLK